ncbi:MAG: trehalose-phosphatase [Desulfuromonadales bacterium]
MKQIPPKLSRQLFDAVIFDMDGVVTRTADVHAAAWKQIFDAYLAERAARTGEKHAPFSIARDYTRYVDGKPRYDGVRDFLASRGIELPEGSTADGPDQATICGIGNRKNRVFQQVLEVQGADRYESTVTLIQHLHAAGIKTAIISASKNARAVLKAAGVDNLFDARVDGCDAEEQGLHGKPAPDVFLAAAKQLEASPQRAVIIEDAQSGVQAGRAGGFGLVIGVDRAGQRDELAKFADIVVEDLAGIEVISNSAMKTSDSLPSALTHFKEVTSELGHRLPAVFLDYDGTLTPIVDRPEMAIISVEMRQAVRDLARYCPVTIISGRDREDVRDLAGIEEVYYAGSHGFDISGPAGTALQFQQGKDFLPALDRAEQLLHDRLDPINGAQIERKKFAVAVHFRRVVAEDWSQVEEAVDAVLAQSDGLRKTGGKRVFELRPDLDWNKGKALAWLLEELGLGLNDALPIYLGDDLTDEDALREIEDSGIGILVRDESRPTHACYALENTAEVRVFLHKLCVHLEQQAVS